MLIGNHKFMFLNIFLQEATIAKLSLAAQALRPVINAAIARSTRHRDACGTTADQEFDAASLWSHHTATAHSKLQGH